MKNERSILQQFNLGFKKVCMYSIRLGLELFKFAEYNRLNSITVIVI